MAARLADEHLARLHARAAELDVPDYRLLRREALVEAIEERGGEVTEPSVASEPSPAAAPATRQPAEEERASREREEEPAEDVPTEEVTGVLEITPQRFGFVRLDGLEVGDGDAYVSASQVRRCELRPGDEVTGPARDPRRGERHRALVHVDRVNGAEPAAERAAFDSLDPAPAERRVPLDRDRDDVLARAVDLLAPLALGQRVLIRGAARSGRTTLLRAIARGVSEVAGEPPIVLLVDERPEEAPAWREGVPGAQFAIATAEMTPAGQLRLARLALERARRRAELGADAVLLVDSLSRLAFAARSRRDPAAEVKRLFGSGRNLADAGSLTVVATVLADSHDEGEADRAVNTTESALITLDPQLAAEGKYPALRAGECRVSDEERLRQPTELEAARRLRSLLADLDPPDAAALLRERIEGSGSNAELLAAL